MGDEPLEPDQVRLTTGEIVRFRLLVKPSAWNPGEAQANIQSSRPLLWARLEGPVATRLTNLESILLDLQYARRCCHLLVAAAGSAIRLDPIIEGALWRAALISYRRCFSAGTRSRPTLPAAEETRTRHDAFIALANGHIAHSIDHFEEFQAFALGRPEDEPPEVVGIHVMGLSHQLGTPTELVQLHELLQVVEKATAQELAALRANVLDEARAEDAVALFSDTDRRAEPMARIGGPSKTLGRRRVRKRP